MTAVFGDGEGIGYVAFTTSEGGRYEMTQMTRFQWDKMLETGVGPDGHTMVAYAVWAPSKAIRDPLIQAILDERVADHDFILGRPRDVVSG